MTVALAQMIWIFFGVSGVVAWAYIAFVIMGALPPPCMRLEHRRIEERERVEEEEEEEQWRSA